MLTCKEFIEFLADYLDDQLRPDTRQTFDEHLGLCPPCVAYLKTYEETIRLGRLALRDQDEALPEDVPEQLVRAILKARARDGRGPS